MKNSMKYFFKESLPSICIITALMTAVYCFVLTMANLKYSIEVDGMYTYYNYPSSCHQTIILMIGALCAIIPITNFSKYKNKNAVDVYASLPISRKSFYIQKLIIGYIKIFIPFTIAYLAGFIVILVKESDLDLIKYIPMYFLLIISSIALYLIFTAFVIKANRVIDSVFYIIFYCSITGSIITTFFSSSNSILSLYFSLLLFPFGSFIYIGSHFGTLLLTKCPEIEFSDYNFSLIMMLMSIVVQIVACFLACVGISNTIKMSKNEDTEERSKTWFGYKTMIPILYSMSIFSSGLLNISSSMVLFLFNLVLETIFYLGLTMGLEFKSFKIPKSRWITFASIFIASILLFFVSHMGAGTSVEEDANQATNILHLIFYKGEF